MSGDDPAFPNNYVGLKPQFGLTKRELFAAMMAMGFCSDPNVSCGSSDLAKYAVEQADKLIAKLNKEQSK